MADVLFGVFLLALSFYVARTWLRWLHSDTKLVPPRWRSGITTFGFAASTVSLATIVLLILYGLVSHSLNPNHPAALLAERIIFASSLAAIVAGIVGTGPLETPTFVCSRLCFLVLVVALFAA